MRPQLFILALTALSLSCCKTVRKPSADQAKEASPGASQESSGPREGVAPAAANAETAAPQPSSGQPILKKVVGALSKEDPKAQHYECVVDLTDLAQPEQVKEWIAAVAKAPIVEALHFRATIPSIQIFAYHQGQEILVFESYSKARYRRPLDENAIKNEAAEELMKIANQKCAYP